jgi:chemotaxis protein histidine kinase CheA
MDIKKRRIEVTKTGKELRKDATKFSQAVIKEEKRIVALLAPIEDHLQSEEDKIDQAKAKIKAEADAKEASRIQARIDKICSFGATFNGQVYSAYGLEMSVELVKVCTDELYLKFIEQSQEAKTTADKKAADEAEAQRIEKERLANIAKEQAAEAQRLADIQAAQEKQAAEIKSAQDTIDAEKKRIAGEEAARLKAIADAQLLEAAKKEAAEKARIETEQRIKRETEEKEENERLAKKEADRKAERQPDKVKLLTFIDTIIMAEPRLKTADAKNILDDFKAGLQTLIKTAREKSEAL